MVHVNTEADKAYFREYYQRNKEHRHAVGRAYWLANRAARLAQSKAWRDAHPGYNTENSRKWRAANPEKQKALVARYQPRCNQLQNERKKKLRREDPDRVHIMDKASHYTRRSIGTIKTADIEYICQRDDWRCGICNRRVNKNLFSLDHIIPISKGGSNALSNLRVAHVRCNAKRRNSGPAQIRMLD